MSKKEGSPGQKRQWKNTCLKMQKNNDQWLFVSIIIVSSVSFAGWLLVERIPGHVRNWGSRGARGGGGAAVCAQCGATAGEEHSVQGEEGEDKWMHCRELQEERAGPDAAHHISTGFTISDMLRAVSQLIIF